MNFKIVPDKDRPAFPLKHFNDAIFDLKVFNIADQLIKDYNGGYWDYIETASGAAFMAPSATIDGNETLTNPFSGEQVEVNRELAGMIVTFYALGQQIEKKATHKRIDTHDKLRDCILDYLGELGRMDVWTAMLD